MSNQTPKKLTADPRTITEKDTWRTPPEILDLVRTLGPIVLDPCTADDNPTGAQFYFTTGNPAPADGAEWFRRSQPAIDEPPADAIIGGVTFANWPYSQNGAWARMVIEHAEAVTPHGQHVIGLANASAGTEWFDRITGAAAATCFVTQRVRFRDPRPPHKPKGGNQWGTAIWYFGTDPDRFAEIFGSIGLVLVRHKAKAIEHAARAVLSAASRLAVDDLAVLTRVAQRLELGRQRYGHFDLSTDKRNWRREKHEELLDMLVYSAARELTNQ